MSNQFNPSQIPFAYQNVRDGFPDGSFDSIIHQTSELLCFIVEKGYIDLWDYFKNQSEKYDNPNCVIELLEKGLSSILNGNDDEKYHFLIEFDYSNILRKQPNLSDLEFWKLNLTKQLLSYVRTGNFDEFLLFINLFKSPTLNLKPLVYELQQKKTKTELSTDNARLIPIEEAFEDSNMRLTLSIPSSGTIKVTVLNLSSSTATALLAYTMFDSGMSILQKSTRDLGSIGAGISIPETFSYYSLAHVAVTLTYTINGTKGTLQGSI